MKKKSHADSLLDSLIISCGSNQSMPMSSIKGNLCYVTCTVMCEICSKLTIRAPDVVLVFLLLSLNIFDTFFWCFFAGFECKWQMEYRFSVYPCVFLESDQEMDQKWAKHMVF